MEIVKVAITGSAGSGKSHVCKGFETLGAAVMDCDRIARDVVAPGTPGFKQVVALFGREVVQKDGTLDRAALRRLIINHRNLKDRMEGILHPLILDEMISRMETARQNGFKVVAAEVPLLFETGMDRFFDVTVVVLADTADLSRRISERDGVSFEDARKMLDLQMPQAEKRKKADHVIENRAGLAELFDLVANIYEKIEKEFLTT